MRYTEKDKNGKYYIVEEKICMGTEQINPIKTWIVENENRGYGRPIDKLGKLEDLEEEIGCPLEVVFKALGNGIYVYNGNHYVVFLKYYKVHNKFRLKDVNGLLYSLEDYKKTWWLKEDKSE